MKGLEKLTSIRLAEVLSQKNVVATDAITDALYTQDQHEEPFVEALVAAGHITEWDLAKVVVEHFQLPFIMASNYEIGPAVKDKVPREILFKHLLVPLDLFGDAVALVMPILTPFEALDSIQKHHDVDVFPFVGLISENKKVLGDMYVEFKEWQLREDEERERRRRRAPQGQSREWMNMFDSADAKVRGGLKG